MTKHFITFTLFLSFAGLSHADYISGVAYSVPAATAENAPTLGNSPGPNATELATFTANGISFSGDAPGAYNLGGFLNSGGVASNIAYLNGATASTTLDNTLWEFTGSQLFTTGQTFNVQHDDGANLYINGSPVLLAGGPTAPVVSTFTYTGPTGTFNFDFIYVECCGGTADFSTTLVSSNPTTGNTPEPSTAYLLALGLSVCAFAAIGRRALKA